MTTKKILDDFPSGNRNKLAESLVGIISRKADRSMDSRKSSQHKSIADSWQEEHRLQRAEGQNDKIGVRLRKDDGNTIRNYGDKQLWPRIGSTEKQYEFHVAEVTQPIPSVTILHRRMKSSLGENDRS